MSSTGFVAYELRGESLDAAIRLDLRVRDFMNRTPPQQSGNLLDIHLSWQKRYREALAEIRAAEPELLAACGLDDPAVQVESAKGAWPRAYESFPAVYWSSAKQPLYLMYSPVDYKGAHFVPKDAVKCAAKDFDSTDMGHLIYKKHFWMAESPIIDGGRRGMALPADYDPATSRSLPRQGPLPSLCFRPGKDTLYAIENFERQKQLFDRTFNEFAEAVHKWTNKNMPGHYASIMLRHDDKGPVLELSFRDKNGGQAVPFAHRDWIIDRRMERDWRNPATGSVERIVLDQYEMRPSPDTDEGYALYMLYKMIPRLPQVHHVPELALQGENGTHYPLIHRHPEGVFIAYNNLKDGETFTPPADCAPVAPAVLKWLERDAQDRQWNVAPPPRPAAMTAALQAAGRDPGNKGPGAPRPPQP